MADDSISSQTYLRKRTRSVLVTEKGTRNEVETTNEEEEPASKIAASIIGVHKITVAIKDALRSLRVKEVLINVLRKLHKETKGKCFSNCT